MLGKEITVFGDGSQIRAFTHVRDMAAGIVLAAEKGRNGVAYNLGNIHNKITILELAEAVRRVVNSNAKIIFVDPKTIYGPLYEEANDKYPDASLAMRDLGWTPKYSYEDAIRDAAAYLSKMDENRLKRITGVA